MDVGARLIGINNRNLASFDTDIRTAMDLVARMGKGQVPVAASGIRERRDIELNLTAGIHNFLIGEHLVRKDDPAAFLRALRGVE
jgi:indole-3-glycerol phosphate synthase